MNFKTLFYVAMAATVMSCSSPKDEKGVGIRAENRDETVRPGDDFYSYACGGWVKANPLPDEFSRFGSFDALAEQCNEQLKTLVAEISTTKQEKGTVGQKIADIYNLAMDSVRRNNEGVKPMLPYIGRIAAVQDKAQLESLIYELSPLFGGIFNFGFSADMKDSKNNILEMYQGGLGLGQKDYYVEQDEPTKKILEAYKEFCVKYFQIFGSDEAKAKKQMENILRIETRLAKASLSQVEMRDPQRLYNKMSVAKLREDFSDIAWDEFFSKTGIKVDSLNVGMPAFMTELGKLFAQEDLESLKDYYTWNVIGSGSSLLSDEVSDCYFDFFGKVLSGRQQQQPRWKRSLQGVNRLLGMALGQLYVEKYFPAAAKERMVNLVKNLQTALGQRIDAQEWMSEETKKKAHEKLDVFYVKVGYPDKWKDYSGLDVDPEKSYLENVLAARQFEYKRELSEKMNKPVDPTEWGMTPQTVNAYYNPTTNEICFPAGILQYPFFDMNADDAFNYGAIGVVIGHEMTHGFDDQGSQFDKDGNLLNWWTEEDSNKFHERTEALAAFFDGIDILPDLKANGHLTLGENLADHGGIEVAFQAFKNATASSPVPTVDGLTAEQRFFLAYAGVWANNIREEEIRRRTKSDPHSLGKLRVNGTLPHIDAWYEAFGIREGDKMFIPEADRVKVW